VILGELLPYPELLLPIILVVVAILPWTLVKVQSRLVRTVACLGLGFGAFFLLGEIMVLATAGMTYSEYVVFHNQDTGGLLAGLSVEAHYAIAPFTSYLSIGLFCFACATTAGLGRAIGAHPAAAFGAMGFVAVLPVWKSFSGALPHAAGLDGLELIVLGLLLSAAPLCWAGFSAVKSFHNPGGRGWAMRILGLVAGMLVTFIIYGILISMQYYFVGSGLAVLPDMVTTIVVVIKAFTLSLLWFFAPVCLTMALAFWIVSDMFQPKEGELKQVSRRKVKETRPAEKNSRRKVKETRPAEKKVETEPAGIRSQNVRVLGPPVQVQKPDSRKSPERRPATAMAPDKPKTATQTTPSAPPTQKKAAKPGLFSMSDTTKEETAPTGATHTIPPPTPTLPPPDVQQQPSPAERGAPPATPTLPSDDAAQPVSTPADQMISTIDPYGQLVKEMTVFYKYLDKVERRLAAPTIVRFRDELTELIINFPSYEGRSQAEQLLKDIETNYMAGYKS